MSRRSMKRLGIGVVCGLLATFVLGFLPNEIIYGDLPNVGVSFERMLGVGRWGYPLPWTRMIVFPGSPLVLVWQNFAADVMIWTAVAYALISIIVGRKT